ncbi:MAG: TIGR02594 family protein [Pseudomonadota bacterium]
MSNFVSNGMRVLSRKILLGAFIIGVSGIQAGEMSKAEAGAYSIAKRYVGLHERKHTGKLSKTLGVNPRRTPWCGAFVGAVVSKAGISVPQGHLRAATWKKAGKGVSLKNARKGDVVVIRTSYGHHVGFYAGQKNGKVQLLGGNQSNQVKVSNYRVGSVQAVRRLGSISKPKVKAFKVNFFKKKSSK